MDLSKLEVGMVVKNYKEMCGLLGEEVKTGTAKMSQIKKWEQSFQFEKKGHNFIVLGIGDIIFADPNAINSPLSYKQLIEKLILEQLLRTTDNELIITKNMLTQSLWMVNENYNKCKTYQKEFSQYMGVSTENIIEFYDLSKRSLTNDLEGALSRLESRGVINFSKVVWVSKAKGNKKVKRKFICFNDDNQPQYEYEDDIEFKSRPATKEEEIKILELIEKTKKEIGCRSVQEIIRNRLWKDYTLIFSDLLYNEMNVQFTYKPYRIVFADSGIRGEYQMLVELESSLLKQSLNDYYADKFITDTERRSKRALEKDVSNLKNSEKKRIKSGYVENGISLTNMLIKKDAPSIGHHYKAIIDEMNKSDF